MSDALVFDLPHYDSLNRARMDTVEQLLGSLREQIDLRTAVDVGCGVGHFSEFLHRLGFNVLALDGRRENVSEAKRRFPSLDFKVADAENIDIRSLGTFDLVLCVGLLYHLENPFAAVRNLFAMTDKLAILEGMCVPGDEPSWAIRDEGKTEDQGLRHVALYPTENGLIKLLYRAGFPFVFRFQTMPAHQAYRTSAIWRQSRTILVAAKVSLATPVLQHVAEPATDPDPWLIRYDPRALAARARNTIQRKFRRMTAQ